ncbi:MAG: type II toxin-antitoxin system RelE/ParE family toxin [Desulfobacteraceae bacterium]|nr:type II toxin-antitoxin system RelE/ParE family toxin [Desulfobacteraceae bacterium]
MPTGRDDLKLAFSWYEQQRRGLGFDFLDCVEVALHRIIENPEMYQIRYSNFRGCVTRRFPFSIFYTVESDEIVVHSVFDNRQDPEKRP